MIEIAVNVYNIDKWTAVIKLSENVCAYLYVIYFTINLHQKEFDFFSVPSR